MRGALALALALAGTTASAHDLPVNRMMNAFVKIEPAQAHQIERHANEAGIVYCLRRSDVEELCADLARRGVPRTPADLATHDTIFGMARSPAREWRFGRGSVVRLSPRLLVDDVEAQLQAAQAGRGIAR